MYSLNISPFFPRKTIFPDSAFKFSVKQALHKCSHFQKNLSCFGLCS